MFWREHHERRAVHRVGPGREDRDRTRWRDEIDLCTSRLADPIRLHDSHALGPIDAVEIQEFLGVLRDLQMPLRQQTTFDQRARTVRTPVDHLFVRQDRLIHRVPIDVRFFLVRQTVLVKLNEKPLVPLVILGVAGAQHRSPIDHRAHQFKLFGHVFNVRVRPFGRIGFVLDRGVFGGQTERIETHREKNVVAIHAHESRSGVGDRSRVPMPDVQVATRVREHREGVILGFARVVQIGGVQVRFAPVVAPAGFDLERVVLFDPGSGFGCDRFGCYRFGHGGSPRVLTVEMAIKKPRHDAGAKRTLEIAKRGSPVVEVGQSGSCEDCSGLGGRGQETDLSFLLFLGGIRGIKIQIF
jgi:hypothetical protein